MIVLSSQIKYKKKAKLRFIFILTVLMAFIGLTESTNGSENDFPFHPGEKLTFQIKWAFIPAGEAVLEVLPSESMNGVKSYHFAMTVKTYAYIDPFYKVRDRIDAYADEEMTHSMLYKKRKEGKSKRDVVVNFNWETKEAQYSNFGKKREPVSLLPGSFDPLSVFYAFRLHDLNEDTEIEKPVTDGKKCVIGKARVLKREKVRVVSGQYDTYLVEPDIEHIGGVFEKTKNARLQIWVTADKRCIPVKIKSRVIVGSFVGELISIEKGDPGQQ
ncbi:MAG: DUF3108 domain-containing protein [Deltaproteobacteria bacterium]|nr:DUF3108 domain-containing protein [Deltaproteobacteria bacterium]